LEDPDRPAQTRILPRSAQTCKLAVTVNANNSSLTCDISVLITVKANRPPEVLPLPHTIPEAIVSLAFMQSAILIVGDDGQYGLYVQIEENRLNGVPERPVHRWTDIVEPQEIPGFLA